MPEFSFDVVSEYDHAELGNAIDQLGPVATEKRYPIHRLPPPRFAFQRYAAALAYRSSMGRSSTIPPWSR